MKSNLNFFFKKYKKRKNIYFQSSFHGYWSNLTISENNKLINRIKKTSTKIAIKSLFPKLYEVIFSERRSAGLELLQFSGKETVIDFGCMWGALSIPIAKQVKKVIAIDQTYESILFTQKRAIEEKLSNIVFLNTNIRDIKFPSSSYDVAVVNGVLEWLPEYNSVELKSYFKLKDSNNKYKDPKVIQKEFLENIFQGLVKKGKLFLAIENRYDYKMFLGSKDRHADSYFTTIFPYKISNFLYKIFKGKNYRTTIYSFNELKGLLKSCGFYSVELYACWPHYHFPEYIIPYNEKSDKFFNLPLIRDGHNKINIKKIIVNRIEWILFKVLKLNFFSPAIIVIAKK
jgi:16S rRNA A1518/A1519 N6-dimethyltransferase RsmA/KsgA/DIM1 with predicted DNA glycosylase/AP lyase activity